MPVSPRPGRSSGSSRLCWPNRASTQAWKRVPNRAAGEGGRGIGRARSAANCSGSSRSRAIAVADRLVGQRDLDRRRRGRPGPRPAAARARRPTPRRARPRRGRAARRRPSSTLAMAARTSVGGDEPPLVLRGALGRPARAPTARSSCSGLGVPVLRASPARRRAASPAARQPRATVRWYGDGAERLLPGRAPLVGGDPELVLGPGERDVAQPQLLESPRAPWPRSVSASIAALS